MRALGIDLAAQPSTTGVVILEPVAARRWAARHVNEDANDDLLVDLARLVDVVGVDSPLGWPSAFVEAVQAHSQHLRWTGTVDRSTLTHRETDRVVRRLGTTSPLSVSADKLGSVAMRCALLQQRWADEAWGAPAPRDGSGRLVEAYPAAAFRAWGLSCSGYKSRRDIDGARQVRAQIVTSLATEASNWLDLTTVADACAGSDHVLDAIACAIVALAAKAHATRAPSEEELSSANVEGWIHVPTTGLSSFEPADNSTSPTD